MSTGNKTHDTLQEILVGQYESLMICWYYNIHIFLGSNTLCVNYINIPPVLRIFGSLVKSRSIYGRHRFRQEADVMVTNPGIIDLQTAELSRLQMVRSDANFRPRCFFCTLFFHGDGKRGKTHWLLWLLPPHLRDHSSTRWMHFLKVSRALGGEEAPLKMYQTRKAKLGKLGGHIRKNRWWFRSSDVSFSFFLAAQERFLEHQHDQQWREVQGPYRKPSFDPAHLLEDERNHLLDFCFDTKRSTLEF